MLWMREDVLKVGTILSNARENRMVTMALQI
jgi:hypothetical protein